jgi:hypothetical protein
MPAMTIPLAGDTLDHAGKRRTQAAVDRHRAKDAAPQTVLRSILRTAIEDPAFASHFASQRDRRVRVAELA